MLETLKRELAASKQELQVLQGTLETSMQVRAWLQPRCQHPAVVSKLSPRPLLGLRWDSWHSSSPKLRGRFPFSCCLSVLARQGVAQQVAVGVTSSIAPLSVPDWGGFHGCEAVPTHPPAAGTHGTEGTGSESSLPPCSLPWSQQTALTPMSCNH